MAGEPERNPDRHRLAAHTTERLLDMALDLSAVTSLEALANAATEHGTRIVGATNSAVAATTDRGTSLRVHQGPVRTLGTSGIRLMDINEITPLTDAVREAREVHMHSETDFAAHYPKIAQRIEAGEVTSMCAFPLESNEQIIGACFFRFSNGAAPDADDEGALRTIVTLLSHALGRIRERTLLEDRAARLRQSNADLENFAAVVAHDFSAPVRRIGSFVQLLIAQIGPLPDKAARHAAIISDQVEHLDQLLRDTLEYSTVTSSSTTAEACALSEIATQVIDPMMADLEPLGGEIRLGELPIVEVEASLIHRVLQNLIENAVKYRRTDRAPRIDITARVDRHDDDDHRTWWRIAVCDNGIGIDPDRHDEIFEMFTRLESTSDRPGTGVGLAFVKRVIERHGGEVGMNPSDELGGTCIWFTIPGVQEPDEL